jgi:hypothetical protein
MKVSDEATQEQLEMAKEQGRVLGKALDHMISQVADDGQETTVGPVPGRLCHRRSGRHVPLARRRASMAEPERENVHIEVSVRDAVDGRFIPNLNIHVRLIDSNKNDVGYHQQPLCGTRGCTITGRNWHIPEEGDYRMEIHIKAPDFPRHDEKNGNRYDHGCRRHPSHPSKLKPANHNYRSKVRLT